MSSLEAEFIGAGSSSEAQPSLHPELAHLRIQHEDIVHTTNNFADEHLLKRGEKAHAYKGMLLRSGLPIHVVIWKYSSTSLTFEFYEVIERLSGIKSFVRFCDEKNERMIVMEHVINGSLHKYQSDPTLKWSQRLNICFDAAVALNKIHNAIRSFKVFLDTEESDVYSFGLLLLEMLYGREVTIKDVSQYIHYYEEGKQLDDFIPPNLRTQMHTKSLSVYSEIVYNCLKKQHKFKQIVKRLKDSFHIQWKHENYDQVLKQKDLGLLQIPLDRIMSATYNFSPTYIITTNMHEKVYKAMRGYFNIGNVLNEEVIVKRIINDEKLLSEDFFIEIEKLNKCSHRNLPSFLGFCVEGAEMILVFECGYKETLSNCLVSKTRKVNLTWERRIRISLDIALGFKYLRYLEAKPSMIISANVFVDEEWTAIIADFRLSEFNSCPTSPAQSGGRREMNDIFFLGVILFEILTGELAYNPPFVDANVDGFASMVWQHRDKKKLMIVNKLDSTIEKPDQESFRTFSKIAYKCLVKDPTKRPTLEGVIKSLREALLLQMKSMKHLLPVPLEDIKRATHDFDKNCRIGFGGFADVYKTELKIISKHTLAETPCTVAIKHIARGKDEDRKAGFKAEIDILSIREHRNIVSLLGYCEEGDEMILVYEYAANGSLDHYLSKQTYNFKWAQRLKMCIDIAQGLEYLHATPDVKENIIHRDIKSANILLGKSWEAKIADFGLSKVHHENEGPSTIRTKNIAGTKGYVDPVYINELKLKKASDIYSLGVVLFEIFSGKLDFEWKNGLAPTARGHFENGTLQQIMDKKIKDETPGSLRAFSKIAYQCLATIQDERPKIEEVIKELKVALKIQVNQMDTFIMPFGVLELGAGNFNEKNIIIKCEHWELYRGEVPYNNGLKKVALKRFHKIQENRGFKEFNVLSKYKQENIIGLAGYCNENEQNIIVYEDASNGCLSTYLNSSSLSWSTRLKICIDIANGLKFLHEGGVGRDVVVHRDIKSSNILLTDDWKAKICGFEFALTYPTDNEIEYGIQDDVVVSDGYCDPMYSETKILTKESDVYSLGVILFEILCGRLALPEDKLTDLSLPLNELVNNHYEPEQLEKIVFKSIKKHIVRKSFDTFRNIAFQCLNATREIRPTTTNVIIQLQQALEFQEAYEKRKAKLNKTYKETLDEFLRSPRIHSKIKKTDVYYILSKGILLEEDKPLIEPTVYDEDDDYHTDAVILTTMKRKYPKRARHIMRIPYVTPIEETMTLIDTLDSDSILEYLDFDLHMP